MTIDVYDASGFAKRADSIAPSGHLIAEGTAISDNAFSITTATRSQVSTLQLTGDGKTPYHLIADLSHAAWVTTNGPVGLEIWDETYSAQRVSNDLTVPSNDAAHRYAYQNQQGYMPLRNEWRIPPFSGTKTFTLWVFNASGVTQSFRIVNIPAARSTFRAFAGSAVSMILPGTISTVPIIPFITSLTSLAAITSPIHGQEVYFQDSGMLTMGVSPWHLRFNKYSPHAFKWDVLSASPMFMEVASNTAYNGTTYAAIQPDFTLPLYGTYDVTVEGTGYHTALVGAYLAAQANGVLSDTYAIKMDGVNYEASYARTVRITQTSQLYMCMGVRVAGAATLNVRNKRMAAMPIRLGTDGGGD